MGTAPIVKQDRGLLVANLAGKYGFEVEKFVATVKATVFPQNAAVSIEQAHAFLVVANHYELNPFVKEIYAFPGRNGGIVPIVSVDGWATLVNRQPQYDGVEFLDNLDNNANLLSVTCSMFRKDRSHPTQVTEYMDECSRDTDPWKKYPARMLRHKAFIQCARYAFGLSGIYDEDEGARIMEAPTMPPAARLPEMAEDPRIPEFHALAEAKGLNKAGRHMLLGKHDSDIEKALAEVKSFPAPDAGSAQNATPEPAKRKKGQAKIDPPTEKPSVPETAAADPKFDF